MNMQTSLIIGLGIAATIAGAFYYYRIKTKETRVKRFDLSGVKKEFIDKEIHLEDIMEYLKSQNLNPNVHIPFIAQYEEGAINDLKLFFENINSEEGYQMLLIGIFDNNSENLSDIRVLYGKGFDSKLSGVIGNQTLIVLQ